jgi:hypothetical protein
MDIYQGADCVQANYYNGTRGDLDVCTGPNLLHQFGSKATFSTDLSRLPLPTGKDYAIGL